MSLQTENVGGQAAEPIADPLTIDNISDEALEKIIEGIGLARDLCHGQAVAGGWWTDIETGEPKERNVGELLMLMVSEIAEAMEGHRKNKMDDHLPHRESEEVEIADLLIRVFDYCGGRGLDVSGAIVEKIRYNSRRADHTIEHRKTDSGKKY